MIDHARIDRHFAIELFTEAAKMDIAQLAKAHIETSNRSFGQRIRYQIARQLRIRSERVK